MVGSLRPTDGFVSVGLVNVAWAAAFFLRPPVGDDEIAKMFKRRRPPLEDDIVEGDVLSAVLVAKPGPTFQTNFRLKCL